MSLSTRRALYGKLAGDTTLTGLLASPPTGYSQSIFYQNAPAQAAFPLVVFHKQSGTPRYAFTTRPAFENDLWVVKAVDRNSSADRADAIASRLDVLLTDGALTISGAKQLYLRRESDIDYAEFDSGVEYRHAGSLYRLVFT